MHRQWLWLSGTTLSTACATPDVALYSLIIYYLHFRLSWTHLWKCMHIVYSRKGNISLISSGAFSFSLCHRINYVTIHAEQWVYRTRECLAFVTNSEMERLNIPLSSQPMVSSVFPQIFWRAVSFAHINTFGPSSFQSALVWLEK